MKEPVLATAADSVDHAVERRVLLVDWIVRIHQIFLRGHLVSTRLAVPNRCLRKHLLVRVHRRSCGWISRASSCAIAAEQSTRASNAIVVINFHAIRSAISRFLFATIVRCESSQRRAHVARLPR